MMTNYGACSHHHVRTGDQPHTPSSLSVVSFGVKVSTCASTTGWRPCLMTICASSLNWRVRMRCGALGKSGEHVELSDRCGDALQLG